LRLIKTVTLFILRGVFTLPWLVFKFVTADSLGLGSLATVRAVFLLFAFYPVRAQLDATEKAGARRASYLPGFRQSPPPALIIVAWEFAAQA
jgi:hypothetical protein